MADIISTLLKHAAGAAGALALIAAPIAATGETVPDIITGAAVAAGCIAAGGVLALAGIIIERKR